MARDAASSPTTMSNPYFLRILCMRSMRSVCDVMPCAQSTRQEPLDYVWSGVCSRSPGACRSWHSSLTVTGRRRRNEILDSVISKRARCLGAMCIAVVRMVQRLAEEARYGRSTRPARHVLRHSRDFQLVYDDKQLTCPSLQQNRCTICSFNRRLHVNGAFLP